MMCFYFFKLILYMYLVKFVCLYFWYKMKNDSFVYFYEWNKGKKVFIYLYFKMIFVNNLYDIKGLFFKIVGR